MGCVCVGVEGRARECVRACLCATPTQKKGQAPPHRRGVVCGTAGSCRPAGRAFACTLVFPAFFFFLSLPSAGVQGSAPRIGSLSRQPRTTSPAGGSASMVLQARARVDVRAQARANCSAARKQKDECQATSTLSPAEKKKPGAHASEVPPPRPPSQFPDMPTPAHAQRPPPPSDKKRQRARDEVVICFVIFPFFFHAAPRPSPPRTTGAAPPAVPRSCHRWRACRAASMTQAPTTRGGMTGLEEEEEEEEEEDGLSPAPGRRERERGGERAGRATGPMPLSSLSLFLLRHSGPAPHTRTRAHCPRGVAQGGRGCYGWGEGGGAGEGEHGGR